MGERETFDAFWHSRFGDVLPLGHDLRNSLAHRWFRIHSLPGSRRYCETPEDYEVMLSRHGAIGDAVLGHDTACWLSLFVSEFPDEPDLISSEREIAAHLGLEDACTGLDHGAYRPGEDGPVPFRIFAARVNWNVGSYAQTLREVADDDIDGLIWTSIATGAVYAPYDGGADLLLPTVEDRKRIAKQFVFWQSSRADGL